MHKKEQEEIGDIGKKKVTWLNNVVSEVIWINSDLEEEVEGCLDTTKTWRGSWGKLTSGSATERMREN